MQNFSNQLLLSLFTYCADNTKRSRNRTQNTYRSIQHPLLAVPSHRQLYIRRIARRHVRFRHEKRRPNLTAKQRIQPYPLLFSGAVLRQDLHVARIWRGAVCRLFSNLKHLSSMTRMLTYAHVSLSYMLGFSNLTTNATERQVAYTAAANPRQQQRTSAYLASRPALPQQLRHQTILDVAESRSLQSSSSSSSSSASFTHMALSRPSQEQIPQAQFLRPLFQIIHDRSPLRTTHASIPARIGRKTLLNAAAELFEIDGVGGDAFLLDEAFNLYIIQEK